MNAILPKPHYPVLDGLRGVAALMVLVFHVFDACSENILPHGYLAVDFFFILSGFVIGYAYDDRWKEGFTTGRFFLRRLIRLHPMVLVGGLIAGIVFFVLGCTRLDGTQVAWYWALAATLCTMLLIPSLPGLPTEVRGFGEFFPLNGPFWSLFYEYIGNILYALVLRRLSTKALSGVMVVSAGFVLQTCLHCGYLGLGWSAADMGWWYGFVRMLFPYTAGMLMARLFKPGKARNTFWWCSALLFLIGLAPVLGGAARPWLNGLFDFFCVTVLFPFIVHAAASDAAPSPRTNRINRFLGDLSYPLYTIHYPFMAMFFFHIGFRGELMDKAVVFEPGNWPWAVFNLIMCPLLAWLLMKYYDQPVRRRLTAWMLSRHDVRVRYRPEKKRG